MVIVMEKKNIFAVWYERLKEVRWGSVIFENGELSKGRLMGWIVFGMLVFLWLKGQEVPPTLMDAFWGLLVYNGGKKLTGPIKDFFESKKLKSFTDGEKKIEDKA